MIEIHIGSICTCLNNHFILGVGITNQRETTIVWDKLTGQPLYNAIGISVYILKALHVRLEANS